MGRNSKNNSGSQCVDHMSGEMRSVCCIRMVAGDGGLNTEVGLGLSIEHSVSDPVRAEAEVKDQEISLTAYTHTRIYTHTHTDLIPCGSCGPSSGG